MVYAVLKIKLVQKLGKDAAPSLQTNPAKPTDVDTINTLVLTEDLKGLISLMLDIL